tara:strand:+ start:9686 stop:9868 length:183 start_codon:yes stop_codon:yes gene_type:complete
MLLSIAVEVVKIYKLRRFLYIAIAESFSGGACSSVLLLLVGCACCRMMYRLDQIVELLDE